MSQLLTSDQKRTYMDTTLEQAAMYKVSQLLTSYQKGHNETFTTWKQAAMYMVSQLLTSYQKGHKETFITWKQIGGVTSFDLRSNMAYKDP